MAFDPFNIEGEQLKWKGWEAPDLSTPKGVGDTVSQGLRATKLILEALRVAGAGVALLTTSTTDLQIRAANAAIQGMIAAINGVIDHLLGTTGLYLLLIPPPKKGLYRALVPTTRFTPDHIEEIPNVIEFPANNIMARGTPEEQAALRRSSLITQILNPTDLFSGGNAYFLKTLMESIHDGRDPNRPHFAASSNWAYGVAVAGGSDLTSLIQLFGFLQRLLDDGKNANGDATIGSLVPQGVRVTPSGHNSMAIIEWEPLSVSQLLASYDRATIEPTDYAIIRSTGIEARTAQRVLDLFMTDELEEGMEGSYGAKVLAVKSYDGVITRYLDRGPWDPALTYYYHIAFATRLRPAGDGLHSPAPIPLGYDLLSGAAEWRKPARGVYHPTSSSGKQPDWIKTPSLGYGVPALGNLIDLVQEFVRKYTTMAENITEDTSAFLRFLDGEIRRYEAIIASIEQRIQRLLSVFAVPSAGFHVTARYGHGNISSFLANVANAFENTSDGERPPFTNGDEFVMGAVALVVAPDLAPVLAAYEVLKHLFDAQNTVDPARAGIESIKTRLAVVEAELMAELREEPPVTFNEDMTPRPVGEGDATCDP